MAGERKIVESHDRQILRNTKAAILSFDQHAQRKHIVTADERIRQPITLDQLPKAFATCLNRIVLFQNSIPEGAQSALRKPVHESQITGSGAVVGSHVTADHADAAMAKCPQVVYRSAASIAIADADVRPTVGFVVR